MLESFMGGDAGMEKMMAAGAPQRRLASPDEIAEAVVWLCSDASSFVTGVALAAIGQVLMKKGAPRGRSLVRSFFDPLVITGYALMLVSTITSTIALKVLPLKMTVALLPLGYIVVVLLSVFLLRERMRRHHVWGMLIILAGIVIFNLGAR